MSPPAPRLPWRAFTALALLVAVVYGRSLANDFVFDDAIFMERDRRLESAAGIRRIFSEPLWAFTDAPGARGVHHYYRPLQLLPLALSHMFFDAKAWPVHLLSLALHAVNAMLLCVLLHRLGASIAVAFLLSAVFALHPINSESVLWASDIAGLGAAACMLGVLLLHRGTLGAWSAPLLIAPLALAATLFKETGVLLLALLVAYDVFAGRGERRRLGDYLAVTTALGVYLVLRTRALGALLPGAGALELSPAELVLNAFSMLPSFVRSFLWPLDLNMYRDFTPARSLGDPRVGAGLAIAAAVVVCIAACARRRPQVAFGLAWLAITAVPHVIVRWPQLNAFAERYLYLPSIGLYAAVAVPLTVAMARATPPMRTIAAAAAATLLALFAGRDIVRAGDWRDEITLYTRTLEQSPRAELIRNNLALRYLHVGRPLEGIPILRELLAMDADFPNGWHNLGLLLLAASDQDGAREAFERAVSLEPGNAATALNLGYVYDAAGRREDAVFQYFRSTALAPDDPKPWYNLAVIAFEQGQLANARRGIAEVLARSPQDESARTLSTAIEKAAASRGTALERRAQDRSAETLRRCNAAREAAAAGRPREARALLQTAAWIDERAPLPHHFLANLAYLAGRVDEAARHERAALERDPQNALYRSNLAALELDRRAMGAGASSSGFRAEPAPTN